MKKTLAIISWSSGKDSAFALLKARESGYDIQSILTTVTAGYDRVSMHGIRVEVLEAQANALGLPLDKVIISPEASNEEYETRMEAVLRAKKETGIKHVVIGDIFLEDLRAYREQKLATRGMQGIFPLWKQDTKKLAAGVIDAGFKAIVTCVDTAKLDVAFSGRYYTQEFLDSLPSSVDPCGENGEFHTFVFDGPIFKKPLKVQTGETVLRDDRFAFTDLTVS